MAGNASLTQEGFRPNRPVSPAPASPVTPASYHPAHSLDPGPVQLPSDLPEGLSGLFVGMTGLSPEKRLLNHRTGYKSSKDVKKNGVCLLPVLSEKLNPMSDEEVRKIEFDLKNAF